jgi:hypothetical protein
MTIAAMNTPNQNQPVPQSQSTGYLPASDFGNFRTVSPSRT